MVRAFDHERLMKARASAAIDRNAQIMALWMGRPPHQRTLEDVVPFNDWLVSFTPWLVGVHPSSLDRVRRIVEPQTIAGDAKLRVVESLDTQRAI
jgi:hypothetical protein